MKTKLQKVLNTSLSPLLSALPVGLLIAALGQATLLASDISRAHDDIQSIINRPFPNQLWLNPHRGEVLAPYLAQERLCN